MKLAQTGKRVCSGEQWARIAHRHATSLCLARKSLERRGGRHIQADHIACRMHKSEVRGILAYTAAGRDHDAVATRDFGEDGALQFTKIGLALSDEDRGDARSLLRRDEGIQVEK